MNIQSDISKKILLLLSFIITFFLLLLLAVPPVASAVGAVVLMGVLYSLDKSAPILLTGALLLAVLLIQATVDSLPEMTYYRPHEKLVDVNNPGRYQKNVNLENFHIPYGDLFSLSSHSFPTIIENRSDITFTTDSLGFRNNEDYSGQDYVLVGDSYVVGNSGIDQDETLASQLAAKMSASFYNAGFPGDLPQHLQRLNETLIPMMSSRSRLILVLFEGNDMLCSGDSQDTSSDAWKNFLPSWVRNSAVYRFSYGLTRRIMNQYGFVDSSSRVVVKRIGMHDVGFFSTYVKQVKKTELCSSLDKLVDEYGQIGQHFALVVFVPSKYTTYVLPKEWRTVQRNYVVQLAKKMGTPLLDLTDSFSDAAKEELLQGNYLYFRDDTHWSQLGVALAAEKIGKALSSLNSNDSQN